MPKEQKQSLTKFLEENLIKYTEEGVNKGIIKKKDVMHSIKIIDAYIEYLKKDNAQSTERVVEKSATMCCK